jgi:hypothetical protein
MKGSVLNFYINNYLVLSKTENGPASGKLGGCQFGYQASPMYVDWAQAGMAQTTSERAGPTRCQIPNPLLRCT